MKYRIIFFLKLIILLLLVAPVLATTDLGNSNEYIAPGRKLGIGTSSPSEALSISSGNGLMALVERASNPSGVSGYGKLFAKSSDSKLYFMNSSGTAYNLTNGASYFPSSVNPLTDAVYNGTTFNLYLGTSAGSSSTATVQNTALGIGALNAVTGDNDLGVGYRASYGNTSHYESYVVGSGAMNGGNLLENVNIGYKAQRDGAGSYPKSRSVSIGSEVRVSETDSTAYAYYSTAVGSKAGSSATKVSFGYMAGNGDTDKNSMGLMVGYQTGHSIGYMAYNTAIGYQSGYSLQGSASTVWTDGGGGSHYPTCYSGSCNILIGYKAGDSITTGQNNIIIGSDADVPAVSSNYKINIGNLIYGDTSSNRIGINNGNPAYQLHVSGDAAKSSGGTGWTISSDRRLKEIRGSYQVGLKEIIQLRPVKFKYKNAKDGQMQYGLIAQEVQKVFPEAVGTRVDGYLDLDMHPINIAMINAVQDLYQRKNQKIKKLKQEIKELEELVSRL